MSMSQVKRRIYLLKGETNSLRRVLYLKAKVKRIR